MQQVMKGSSTGVAGGLPDTLGDTESLDVLVGGGLGELARRLFGRGSSTEESSCGAFACSS